MKERAELRTHHLGRDVGNGLHELFEIALGDQHRADAVQQLGNFARLALARE